MKIQRPTQKQGQILADLHTHPGLKQNLDFLVERLTRGITGIAQDNDWLTIWNYQDLIEALKVKSGVSIREVNQSLLAEINYNGQIGYITKTQEVCANNDHHILAFGCRENFPNKEDPRTTVEKVHKKKGLAILNHPYVFGKRIANEIEELTIKELYQMVDEVEIFNAQCIDLIPPFICMKEANKKAKELASQYEGIEGIASSDAHYEISPIGTSGIYIPNQDLNIEAIMQYIKSKNFERYEQYVDRWTFFKEFISPRRG